MEAMPYTQSLLANGMGVGYHAIAAAPTVTMPRLKVSVNSSFKCGSVSRAYWFEFTFYFSNLLLSFVFVVPGHGFWSNRGLPGCSFQL
jgi:ethanolaminephosphotransferase